MHYKRRLPKLRYGRSLAPSLVLFVLVFFSCPLVMAEMNLGSPPDDHGGIESYLLPDLAGQSHQVPTPGSLTLINFWATFCSPCLQEMPSLDRLWQTYKHRGLQVQAVALDGDRKRAIEKFVQRLDLKMPVLLDDDSGISRDYRVSVMPVTYLVAADGTLIGRMVGERDWSSEEAIELIERHLPDTEKTSR